MSEDRDQDAQTEEATEKKLHEARERGNVPHSREPALLAALAAMLISLIYLVPSNAQLLGDALAHFVDDPSGWRIGTAKDFLLLISPVFVAMVRFVTPILAVMASFGVAAAMAQNGVQIAPDRIMPDLSRISLSSGAARIFGVRGLIEFFKSAGKFLTIVGFTAAVFNAQKSALISAMFADPSSLPDRILALAARLIGGAMVAMLVIAGADLVWVRIRWRRDQRMTRQELKEEIRQTEGDSLLKSRLRSLRLQRSRKRMLNAVPRATMVIANPTHYAVALRYVRGEAGAPLVLAKGKNLIALKIRAAAEAHAIPVIEDRKLARSLYEATVVDHPIPPEFYRAVAEIVHLLQEKKNSWYVARQRASS
jgi:flagellar biosynthesis protein FlhB